jgi:hypothetical protein
MTGVAGDPDDTALQVRSVAGSATGLGRVFLAGFVCDAHYNIGVIGRRTSRYAGRIAGAVSVGTVRGAVSIVVDTVITDFCRHACGERSAVGVRAVYQTVAVVVDSVIAHFGVRSTGWIKLAVRVGAVNGAVSVVVDIVIADRFGGGDYVAARA